MTKLLKLDFRNLGVRKGQRRSSLLGLTLDGSRLDGVVVRRTNGSVQIQQAFSVTLSLDPLTNDAELVGREIRNHLDAAGVRERQCLVGLPLKWVLTAHATLPALAEEDLASFLQIEAERIFPCDVTSLLLATSRYQTSSGEQHATLVGIPRSQAEAIEKALRAAHLKPVSFSLGVAALQPPESEASNGVLALAIGESHVGLQITCGGGIAALRALEGALENEAGQRRLHADVIAREVRITLSQLPGGVREAVKRVRIFGPRNLAQELADEIEVRLEAMDLEVELAAAYGPGDFPVQIPPGSVVSPAFSLATGYLAGRDPRLDFLPPHITAWQQFARRHSSGKLQQAGFAVAAVALLVAVAFGVQQWQLWRLNSQWSAMGNTVSDLKKTQASIRQFRPWFDFPVRGLTILRSLTQAFPEDGAVTAKSVEIRDSSTITCTGTARDYTSLLKTKAKLGDLPGVREVNLGQTRGQPPTIQFSFSFIWNEGGNSGN
jgi:hypothetical protein